MKLPTGFGPDDLSRFLRRMKMDASATVGIFHEEALWLDRNTTPTALPG